MWSCTQVQRSTFNIELKDIFLYLYVYSCLYHELPHHRITTHGDDRDNNSNTMSPHHQHHHQTKKVISSFFLYHFHFTNNILGAIDSDNVNDRTAPPPQSPLPSPHRRNMFTPTLSPPPPHQCIHHHHHHHPTSTCHQQVPVTRW